MLRSNSYKDCIGFGNAIVDAVCLVSQDTFDSLPAAGGNPRDRTEAALARADEVVRSGGGSVANTVYGLAYMGADVAFVGSVGEDIEGDIFLSGLVGADTTMMVTKSGLDTASCVSIVPPGGQRYMSVDLGAALHLGRGDIPFEVISTARSVMLEAYLLDNPAPRAAFMTVWDEAERRGVQRILTLGSASCVTQNAELFEFDFMLSRADLLFANDEEAEALRSVLGMTNATDALRMVSKVSVLTAGPKGGVVVTPDTEIAFPVHSVPKVVDTTGAGDGFAAGFIKGMLDGYGWKACAGIGAAFAAQIVQQAGARLPAQDSYLSHSRRL